MTLILHGGDSSCINPVDRAGVSLLEFNNLSFDITANTSEHGFVFGCRPVRKLVVAHGEVLLNCISCFNPGILSSKEGKSGVKLGKVKIVLAKLGQVLHEFVIDRSDGSDGTDAHGESERFHLTDFN